MGQAPWDWPGRVDHVGPSHVGANVTCGSVTRAPAGEAILYCARCFVASATQTPLDPPRCRPHCPRRQPPSSAAPAAPKVRAERLRTGLSRHCVSWRRMAGAASAGGVWRALRQLETCGVSLHLDIPHLTRTKHEHTDTEPPQTRSIRRSTRTPRTHANHTQVDHTQVN